MLEGESHVDESMVSGEPIPVQKHAGDQIIGATINGTGGLVMRAEKVGAETLLSRIVAMVAEAQRSRAPIQKLADAVAGYFVPIVILSAVATFAVWALVGPEPKMAHALINAVAVLIIACPCALGLATPMSIGMAVVFFPALRSGDHVDVVGCRPPHARVCHRCDVDARAHRRRFLADSLTQLPVARRHKRHHALRRSEPRRIRRGRQPDEVQLVVRYFICVSGPRALATALPTWNERASSVV